MILFFRTPSKSVIATEIDHKRLDLCLYRLSI